MSKNTTAAKIETIWSQTKDEKGLKNIQGSVSRIKLNAEKTILDLKDRVGQAETLLEVTIEDALKTHNFSSIVNAETNLQEEKDLLAAAEEAKAKYLG